MSYPVSSVFSLIEKRSAPSLKSRAYSQTIIVRRNEPFNQKVKAFDSIFFSFYRVVVEQGNEQSSSFSTFSRLAVI